MADFVKVGNEFKVNNQTADFQDFPSITGLAGGGFVATWMDTSGPSWLGTARAQIFNVAGQAVGAEFAISTGAATDQSFPTIASLANGGFVVTWTEAGTQADFKIKAQVHSASGAVVTPAFLVNGGTWTQQGGNNMPGQHSTTIAGLAGGGFVVTWQDYAGSAGDSSGSGILAQLYTAGGVPSGAAFRVNTQTSQDQSQPVVTSLTGGGFVVTWIDGNAVDPLTGFPAVTMKAQLFTAAGAKVGSEVLVDAKVLNDQSLPTVTGLSGGGFVVSWQDSSPATGEPDTAIRAAVFDAAGVKVGTSFTVSSLTGGERDFPSITSLSNGGFVVTWQHFVSAEDSDIKAQVYNADGSKSGSELTINTVTASYQERPVVSSLLGGGFVVAWGDSSGLGGDADGTSIKAQVYSYGAFNMVYGTDAINALTGTGGDDHILGLGGNDTLTGLGGNDRLDGGTGNDTMIGGLGDDTYVVDASDIVSEAAGQGTDTVETTRSSYTLGNNVENLTFIGSGNRSGKGNTLNNTLTGASGNDTLNGSTGADRMIGGLGNDLYYVENAGDVVVEAAGAGTDTVHAAISWTLAANVENLTLAGSGAISATGNDDANVITGNSGANVLTGQGGNDTLNGGAGADTLVGGLGNDSYVVDNLGDVVSELAAQGTDLVMASVTYTLAANVENLTLSGSSAISGTGNGDANVINGNSGNNVLTGLGGNDTLNGGSGSDTMIGGQGDDIYVVDRTSDVVTELVGEGNDTVQTTLSSYTLAANVEALVFTNNATHSGTGNALDNRLTGNVGNDTLNGGAGADTMIGGLGNDSYFVDNTGDVVIELAAQGTDLVTSSIGWTLAANLENLTLSGTAAINGTGNGDANVLNGNSGANVLTGLGGNDTLNGAAGADTLIGGLGDDIYIVDNASDAVIEVVGQGTDTVQTSLGSWTLASEVENLVFTNSSSHTGIGNALANRLTGNNGNDTLNGGLGADTMIGGLGNDNYVVDNAGDVVTEAASAGTDTVTASINYTLGANVENLTLAAGTSALGGTGNALANVLTGNSGSNLLAGMDGDDTLNGGLGDDTLQGGVGNDRLTGGNGNDVLNGGAGVDTFVFDTAASAITNLDTVQDFASGSDVLAFRRGVFSAFSTTGGISADAFWSGAGVNAAHDATDRFIYNTTTGALWYDRDGTGSTAAVQVAILTGQPALAHTDFQIIA